LFTVTNKSGIAVFGWTTHELMDEGALVGGVVGEKLIVTAYRN
jgi:hypothetical protein